MRNLIITIIIGIIAPFVTFAQGSNERQVREHYDLLIARYENERYAFQDGYNRWLQEGRGSWSEEEWRHNLQTLRDEITRCDREIARLRNERDNRVREAQQRDRQQAEQYRAAQKKQQIQQQNAQRLQQQKIAQQQRESYLEAQREQARREQEERRKAEELARQIKYEKDYNDEIRRTSGYYADRRSEMNWMASRDAINQMYSSFERSRLEMSIEDVKPQVTGTQIAQAAGVSRLKKRVSESASIGPVFEDGFFNNRVFHSLNEDVFLNSPDLVWLKANKEIVQDYWARIDKSEEPSADYPLAYTEWLYEQFKELSGYDIKEILHKVSRTEGERQALLNFNMFSTQLLNEKESELNSELATIDITPERKVADMAILSAIPYGTNNDLLSYTDYKLIDSSTAPDEVKDLAKMIELCNDDTYGFHAQLFYNDKTNTYTISYEGSTDPDVINLYGEYKRYLISKGIEKVESWIGKDLGAEYIFKDLEHSEAFKDWVLTNAQQGLYGIPNQFKLVGSISSMINKIPNANVQITGHSLGGGLASFCGLLTGRETTTFNAEGVNWNIIWEGGAEARQRAVTGTNITAYHDRSDILTKAQKHTPATEALGKEIIVDVDPKYKEGWTDKLTGHMIVPMAKHFIYQDNESMNRWRQIASIKEKYNESFFELSLSSLAAQ